MGKTYGYLRVSTQGQHEDRQEIAMRAFGVPDSNLIVDKQSGKNFEREGYRRLMKMARAGDVIVVQSIDRLGRNYEEILAQWRMLTKERGIAIVVLDMMPLLDTRERNGGDLTGTLIADIVLQVLSYVAEKERELCRKRTMEGIAAAKARGVQLGRRPKEPPESYAAVCSEWRAGRITAGEAGQRLAVSRNTFLRWARAGV